MNDLTLEEVKDGEEVLFFLKPHDKTPHMITTIIDTAHDDRGRPWVNVDGIIEWIPLYHIKKMPADAALIKAHSAGIADKTVELIKGLDY